MTAQEVIDKIRAEIERLKSLAEQMDYQKKVGFNWALDDLLSILSDLEKSVKPISGELNDAIDKWLYGVPIIERKDGKVYFQPVPSFSNYQNDWKNEGNAGGADLTADGLRDIARHFYELGCRRTAEKFDELEYNRQRAEESEKPMEQDGLEEEIKRYLEPIHTADIQFEPFTQMTKCARHFAKWGAKHLKQ